jgi:hypothetical protein
MKLQTSSLLVVKTLGYKSEGRGFESRWGEILNLPNPSGRTRHCGLLGPWQKGVPETLQKKCFWGVKCGWCVVLTTLPPSTSRFSIQCGILNISQPYRPPRPVTGITFTLLSAVSITGEENAGDSCVVCGNILVWHGLFVSLTTQHEGQKSLKCEWARAYSCFIRISSFLKRH